MGAGTGVFTRQLLQAGFEVHAVEPNPDMRQEAEASLSHMPGFASIAATAEATTLPTHTLDAISCAQAFHWFDSDMVIPEFRRILKPGGPVCLIWNNQRFGSDPFHRDYEAALIRGCPAYAQFDLAAISYDAPKLKSLFDAGRVDPYRFDNAQVLDLEGLQGRISSVSYCPPAGSQAHQTLMSEVEALFDTHQRNGVVRILYDVEMYVIRF
ncbi:MAG: class I SAM-dependent methyltransferase [Aquabacterium sp.]